MKDTDEGEGLFSVHLGCFTCHELLDVSSLSKPQPLLVLLLVKQLIKPQDIGKQFNLRSSVLYKVRDWG